MVQLPEDVPSRLSTHPIEKSDSENAVHASSLVNVPNANMTFGPASYDRSLPECGISISYANHLAAARRVLALIFSYVVTFSPVAFR